MRSTFPPNQFGNVPLPSANFYGLPIDEVVPALLERALVFSTEGNPVPQCLPNEHQYLVAVSSATDLARKLIKSKSRLFPVRGPGISMHPSSNELGQEFLRALHPCINFLRSQSEHYAYSKWFTLLSEQIVERDLYQVHQVLQSGPEIHQRWMADVLNAAADAMRWQAQTAVFRKQQALFAQENSKNARAISRLFSKFTAATNQPALLPLVLTLGASGFHSGQNAFQAMSKNLADVLSRISKDFLPNLAGYVWKHERRFDGTLQVQLLLLLRCNSPSIESDLQGSVYHDWTSRLGAGRAAVFSTKTGMPWPAYRGCTSGYPGYGQFIDQLRRFHIYFVKTDDYFRYQPPDNTRALGLLSLV